MTNSEKILNEIQSQCISEEAAKEVAAFVCRMVHEQVNELIKEAWDAPAMAIKGMLINRKSIFKKMEEELKK